MPPKVHVHVTTSEQQRLYQRKAGLLPWIANPLHLFLEHHKGSHAGHRHELLPTSEEGQPEPKLHHTPSVSSGELGINEEIEAEEAATFELFYDLFFVANLTTITSVHEMTDRETIISYILFFVLLWFTWLQTTLYDIRFARDSFYERVIRTVHFAVMMGLASVSTNWNPMDPSATGARNNLQSMSLTLMASRLALSIQYGVAMAYAWRDFKHGVLPLVIHSVTMLAAGAAYLGLHFTFGGSAAPKTYIAWYGIIILEVIAVMGSSSYWKVLSFKRTHLVERLGLLTLIIIGEGVIVMLKAVNAVEKGQTYGRGWTASIFFIVAAAVGILYMLYMFYFDYTPRNVHYGTIRQQLWAVMHFPFHLAMVLSVEGLRQLSTWWSFLQANKNIDRRLAASQNSTDPQVNWWNALNETQRFLQYLYDDGTATDILKNWDEINSELSDLASTPIAEILQDNHTRVDLYQLQFDMVSGFAEFYGIELPEADHETSVADLVESGINPELYSPANNIREVYSLVYTYFYASLAVVFFMYGILGLFVRRRKDVWDYFSVGLRFAVGFVFIGIEQMKTNETLYANFMDSPWPIPTVAIVLFVALFIDKVVGIYAFKRMHAAKDTFHHHEGAS